MITVFSGTNRPNSLTGKYARYCFEYMSSQLPGEVQFFSLEDFPQEAIHHNMYTADDQEEALKSIQDKYVIGANGFFVVSPEYNGSFPGILKTFIDACSIREYQKSFSNKKIGLLGVASGRAGNLRGLDHLTGIFQHMNGLVMPKAMPIGQSDKFMNESGEMTDEEMKKGLEAYMNKFIAFYQEPVQIA